MTESRSCIADKYADLSLSPFSFNTIYQLIQREIRKTMAGLTRFITIQVFFCLLATALTGYMLNSALHQYANSQQLKVQRAIDLELSQVTTDQDIEAFAKSIKLQYNLDKLVIKDKENETVFSNQGNLNYLPFLVKHLQNYKPFIRSQHGAGSDLGLKIEFTLRLQQTAEIVQNAFLILFLIKK